MIFIIQYHVSIGSCQYQKAVLTSQQHNGGELWLKRKKAVFQSQIVCSSCSNKKAKKESKFDNKKQSRADDKSRPEAI